MSTPASRMEYDKELIKAATLFTFRVKRIGEIGTVGVGECREHSEVVTKVMDIFDEEGVSAVLVYASSEKGGCLYLTARRLETDEIVFTP